jgi:adenylate cyclase
MRGILRRPKPLVLPSSGAERQALVDSYRKRLFGVSLVAALVASLPQWVSYPYQTALVTTRALSIQVFVTAGYFAAYLIGTWFYVGRITRPLVTWLEQQPGTADVGQVEALPRKTGLWQGAWWCGVLLYAPPLLAATMPHIALWKDVYWMVITVAASAPLGVLFTYFLAERVVRPLVGLANRGARRQSPKRSSALRRLLVAIAAGSAPLLTLSMFFVGVNAKQRAALATGLWPQAVVEILGLFAIAFVAVRSVTEPVDEIRRGFDRLEAGDLDVDVQVDEPGEIGDLQVGFNRMVRAMREREQMHDVFVRLVGKDVAQHAIEHGGDLANEVREASAMFVDVVGSTPLAESSTPAEYLTTLNSFFDVVVQVVERNGGVVNQFQGDGALCIFGAPNDQPDHAVRALKAARELRDALDDFSLRSGIEAVIGVSTGDVVAGHIGTSDRYEFTVVGDAVNEAKRLAEQSKESETKVFVSGATIRAAEGEVGRWHDAGQARLRGRSQSTEIYAPGRRVT